MTFRELFDSPDWRVHVCKWDGKLTAHETGAPCDHGELCSEIELSLRKHFDAGQWPEALREAS